MSTPKRRGLGRSLDALLGAAAPTASAEAAAAGEELREIALDQLAPGRHQPRRHFDEDALNALADSIRAQGVVQPIVVREAEPGRYEIVAGERRWRASKLAGLAAMPAVVRRIDDRTAMAVALVENIQRADLNALEESEALRRLIDECGLTHEQAAEAVGKSRAAVSNLLRLLELQPPVQVLVRDGRLSQGHAKVLLGAAPDRQAALAETVIERRLSVRETEALLAAESREPRPPRRAPSHPLAQSFTAKVGLPVQLRQAPNGRGRLTIDFRTDAELQALLSRLG